MINYELALQNFFYKISSIQGKLRPLKLLHVYKLYIISTGNLHEKEFSHMYLQRSDESQTKRDSMAMGFFVGFVPINELSGSQGWMSWSWIVYLAFPLTQNGIRQKSLSREPVALFEK